MIPTEIRRPVASETNLRNATGIPPADTQLLAVLLTAYAVIYAVTFPHMYTSLDESDNFGMAYVLRQGTIHPSTAHTSLSMDVPGAHGSVYRFPIGFPLILAGMSYLGSQALFLVNPIMHLLATWFFARTLKLLECPVWLAAIYLFYPGFVLYQRTLFSDGFAASLTAIALYNLLSGRMTAAGVMMGLSVMSRSTSAVIAVLLAAGLAIESRKRGDTPLTMVTAAAKFCLGLLPFFIATGVYNELTMGSPLKSTYSGSLFAWHAFKTFAPFYIASLALVPPGMFFAPLAYRGPYRQTLIAICGVVFLIAASYHESTFGENRLQSLITVSRQVLPAMPFFLLAYCTWLGRFKGWFIVPRTAAVLSLLVVAAGMSWIHYRVLGRLLVLHADLARVLPPHAVVYANKDVFKLHQHVWDPQTYRMLNTVTVKQVAVDMHSGPVFVVTYYRNRGVENEDNQNNAIQADLKTHWILTELPSSAGSDFHYYRVQGYHT